MKPKRARLSPARGPGGCVRAQAQGLDDPAVVPEPLQSGGSDRWPDPHLDLPQALVEQLTGQEHRAQAGVQESRPLEQTAVGAGEIDRRSESRAASTSPSTAPKGWLQTARSAPEAGIRWRSSSDIVGVMRNRPRALDANNPAQAEEPRPR